MFQMDFYDAEKSHISKLCSYGQKIDIIFKFKIKTSKKVILHSNLKLDYNLFIYLNTACFISKLCIFININVK